MWTLYVLPFLEDTTLRDFGTVNDVSVNNNWAVRDPYNSIDALIANAAYPGQYNNVKLAETVVTSFRCPSAGLPLGQVDNTADNWWVMLRSPISYLGCMSGTVTAQFHVTGQSDEKKLIDWQNGVFIARHAPDALAGGENIAKGIVSLQKVKDGLSKTIIVAEALHDVREQERVGATRPEPSVGDHKDHWAMGSDDIDTGGGTDISETVGSTGVPINVQNTVNARDVCQTASSDECQSLQLSFSSAHPGGCMVARGDVSVEFVNENIDPQIWSDLGTRASQKALVYVPPR